MPLLYAHALEQVKNFTFTIPTEELTTAAKMLNSFFGVKARVVVDTVNRNSKGASRQVDYLQKNNPGLLRQIEMLDSYDLCLYRHIKNLWKVQKQALSEIFGL